MKQPSLFDPPKRKPRPVPAEIVQRMETLAQAAEFLRERVGRRLKKLPADKRRMAARPVSEVEGLIGRMEGER